MKGECASIATPELVKQITTLAGHSSRNFFVDRLKSVQSN